MKVLPQSFGLAVLLGLAACSSDPADGPKPDTDTQTPKTTSIRVAGFVATAGIT